MLVKVKLCLTENIAVTTIFREAVAESERAAQNLKRVTGNESAYYSLFATNTLFLVSLLTTRTHRVLSRAVTKQTVSGKHSPSV
jgi:hypothetical protein